MGALVTGYLWGMVRISEGSLTGRWSPQRRSRAELRGRICLRLCARDEAGLPAGDSRRGLGACGKMDGQFGLADWEPIRHPLAPDEGGRWKIASKKKLDEHAFFDRAFLCAVLRVIPHDVWGLGGNWESGWKARPERYGIPDRIQR